MKIFAAQADELRIDDSFSRPQAVANVGGGVDVVFVRESSVANRSIRVEDVVLHTHHAGTEAANALQQHLSAIGVDGRIVFKSETRNGRRKRSSRVQACQIDGVVEDVISHPTSCADPPPTSKKPCEFSLQF